MKNTGLILLVLAGVSTGVMPAESNVVKELLLEYATQGATVADAAAGQRLWFNAFHDKRSCTNGHGEKLKQTGRHVRTKKLIEPMAPSVNPNRLQKAHEIRKWFKRNCKWTLGRECTASEKANLLAFIMQQ